jgi:hypothetical protein
MACREIGQQMWSPASGHDRGGTGVTCGAGTAASEGSRGGAGWVGPPEVLERKYPNAGRESIWQWMLPATRG